MTSENEVKNNVDQVIRLLERFMEFRFALILISAVVLADSGLVIMQGQGILGTDWTKIGNNDYVRFGLIAVAYAFWMAVISPLARTIAEIGIVIFGPLISRVWSERDDPKEFYLRAGKVPLKRAKSEMLESRDTFWLEQIDRAEKARVEEKRKAKKIAHLSFSTALLMLGNYCLLDPHSMLFLFAVSSGIHGGVVKAVLLLLIVATAFPWLYWVIDDFVNGWRDDAWIEHPELAKRVMAEDEERRQRQRSPRLD